MRDMLSGEKTRIPMVLLTQAQYEVHMSEKSLGAETYREIEVYQKRLRWNAGAGVKDGLVWT